MPAPSRLRRRLTASALAAVLALLPAGCDLDGRDPNAPQIVENWVIVEEPPPAPGTPPNVELQPGTSLIGLSGDFVRTCTTGRVGVTHTFDGSALTFRASFFPHASCATAQPIRQLIRYSAYLTRVPPGTYQVRIIHVNDDLVGESGTVLEQTVTVL